MVKNISEEQIKHLIDNAVNPNLWDFGNSILYDLCQKNPLHKEEDKIIAKVWLIGRAYAAAIERTVKNKSHDFYVTDVGKTILKNGETIDRLINQVKNENEYEDIQKLYGFVMKVFMEISGKRNLSLTSKYLHFHLPDVFYIYDTRSVRNATILWRSLNGKRLKFQGSKYKALDDVDFEEEYMRFYLRCWDCVRIIKEKYSIELTPRQLDNLLLSMDVMEKGAIVNG